MYLDHVYCEAHVASYPAIAGEKVVPLFLLQVKKVGTAGYEAKIHDIG